MCNVIKEKLTYLKEKDDRGDISIKTSDKSTALSKLTVKHMCKDALKHEV